MSTLEDRVAPDVASLGVYAPAHRPGLWHLGSGTGLQRALDSGIVALALWLLLVEVGVRAKAALVGGQGA